MNAARAWRRALLAASLLFVAIAAALFRGPLSGPLSVSQVRATADVPVNVVVGTRVSFEISSYVSDFVLAFTSPLATREAASAAGAPPDSTLEALRTGENSGAVVPGAVVAYTASSAERAEAGLKAAAREALRQLARSDLTRAQIQYAAARESLVQLRREFSTQAPGLRRAPPGDVVAARRAAFGQAADQVESRIAQVAAARGSLAAVDRVVDRLVVTPKTTSRVTARGTAIAVAGAGSLALLVAGAAVPTLVSRRAPADPS